MSKETQKKGIIRIYQQLYQYKHLIPNAPELSIDIAQTPAEQVESQFETINEQLANMVAYLLGLHAETMNVTNMIDSLQEHYKEDDFWRLVLLDYMDIRQEQEEEALAQKKQAVQTQAQSLYQRIIEYQRRRNEIITAFANKLNTQKFPINAERLFKNYLNMADIDAKQAWSVVITNPAAFSPILVEDSNGKRIISIRDAKKINKQIGHFIKSMKA